MARKSLAHADAAESSSSPHKKSSKSSRKSHPQPVVEITRSSPDPIALTSPPSGPSTKRKRGNRKEEAKDEAPQVEEPPASAPAAGNEGPVEEEFSLDQQLEAWQDFAAEHYEMVEQLPLELHRNFRLLRELDDGCVSQTTKLQEQIRAYVDARVELVKRYNVVAEALQPAPVAIVNGESMEVDGAEEPGPAGEVKGVLEDTREKESLLADLNEPQRARETDVEGAGANEDIAAGVAAAVPPRVNGEESEEEQEQIEEREPVEVENSTESAEEARAQDGNQQTEKREDSINQAQDGNIGEEVPIDKSTEATTLEDTVTVQAPTVPAAAEAVSSSLSPPAGGLNTAGRLPPAAAFPAPAPAPAPPMPELPPDMGQPIPDGEGGLVVPSSDDMPAPLPPRKEFPPLEEDLLPPKETANEEVSAAVETSATGGEEAEAITGQGDSTASTVDAAPFGSSSSVPIAPEELPSRFLAEIGRLSREVVRNCEEKVALAVGAYNSIDRHIRALDSALSAQETSLILGLRPDTLPSAGVDQTLNLAGDTSGLPLTAEDETPGGGGMVLGLGGGAGGGGGRNGRKKKGKKGKKGQEEEEVVQAVTAVPEPAELEMEVIDPNEPRYCYCNKVSFGTMIGCDNDDCPLEWFHLPCTGLQVEPAGSWMCTLCKPKIGLGMGGAGSVQPGGEKRAAKRRKRF